MNSPYLALGLESDNKDLFRTSNSKHIKVIMSILCSYMERIMDILV